MNEWVHESIECSGAGTEPFTDAQFESTAQLVAAASRAWLETLSATWSEADVPEAKAELLHAIYERTVVTGRTIASIRLTPSAYAHDLELALRDKVALARPTGVRRAGTHSESRSIPIKGTAGNSRR